MAKRLIVDQKDAGSRPVTRAISSTTLAWLAGLLEGEGSFVKGPPSAPNSPRITLQMTDKDVMERAATVLDVSVQSLKSRQLHWKQSYALCLRGQRALQWMRLLRPLMGIRRQQQIDCAVASFDSTRLLHGSFVRVKTAANDLRYIRSQRAKGISLRVIASGLGVDHETIRRRLRDGLPKSLEG